jgi:N-acetylmuramoyl-L-alanine amidase
LEHYILVKEGENYMNLIDPKLKFLRAQLTEQQERQIAIVHSRVPNSTVYDAHIEGLNNGEAGAECHYFIDKLGTVYIARDEKFATKVAEDTVVIRLEGNLDINPLTDEQKVSLTELCNKVKKDHKISTTELDVTNAGSLFPVEEFLSQFSGSEVAIEQLSEEVVEESAVEEVVEKPVTKKKTRKSRR